MYSKQPLNNKPTPCGNFTGRHTPVTTWRGTTAVLFQMSVK